MDDIAQALRHDVALKIAFGQIALTKDDFLKFLIGIHEPAYADQWRALDAKYQTMMMSAISAFQLRVTRLQSKFKLNQHRTEAHASMKAIYAAGGPDEQALGKWMERLGL